MNRAVSDTETIWRSQPRVTTLFLITKEVTQSG